MTALLRHLALLPDPSAMPSRLGRLRAGQVLAIVAMSGTATVVLGQGLAPGRENVGTLLLKWMPLVVEGFLFNLLISVLTMIAGSITGILLGVGSVSPRRLLRALSRPPVLFFRNAPWLVVLFGVMLLFPFETHLFGITVVFPAWLKAVFGLSLPVMANLAETVRGAIQSLPRGQWEAAQALSLSRGQIMRLVILPQAFRRMIPPWMNQYAILTMNTTIISIVGIQEGLAMTQAAQVAEGRSDLLIPAYLLLLLLFFVYCYPIARFTLHLERRITGRAA